MHKVLKIAIVLMMLVGLIGTAHATTSILYFNDGVLGTDRMAVALGSLGAPDYSVNTVYTPGDFATQIATPGAYNLGILMVQAATFDSYDTAITALGAFVAGGGRSIYTNSSLDEAGAYAGLFGATWTGFVNELSFTVTNPLANLITNPVGLDDPGWTNFSMGVSPVAVDGLVAAAFPSTYGAIAIGNDGRSITNGFFTDTFAGDGSQGVQLYTNEIKYLTDPAPLPGAVWLLGSGLLGLGLFRGRMRKN